MGEMAKNLAAVMLTPECIVQYWENYNFLHGDCMKATISKALGIIIIIGSFTVKVPQILQMMKNKSGEGISLTGTLLELLAITSTSAYCFLKRFPFSAWGDGLFMAIQTAAIVALILSYQNQVHQTAAFVAVYSTIVFLSALGFIPVSIFWMAQFFNLPIIILGKGVQAVSNYRNQSTGQLSAITLWMQFGGCLARVFTSVQETGDATMILTYVTATILNGLILFQLYYYASVAGKKGKSKGKRKEKKLD